jgi:ornithine decarboxylase
MMKGKSGEVLWDDTIRLGIELRKKLRAVRKEFEEKEKDPARRWFFEPFVPDRVSIPDAARQGGTHDVAWESVSTDQLARHAYSGNCCRMRLGTASHMLKTDSQSPILPS